MTAIEQRARELLAAAFACDPEELLAGEVRAVRAVLVYQAALTPLEGYVLVPAEPPVREIWSVIKGDGLAAIDQIDGENPDSARHQHLGWLQLAWPELLRMLAARPEVKS